VATVEPIRAVVAQVAVVVQPLVELQIQQVKQAQKVVMVMVSLAKQVLAVKVVMEQIQVLAEELAALAALFLEMVAQEI
jgi:hypothetical protein